MNFMNCMNFMNFMNLTGEAEEQHHEHTSHSKIWTFLQFEHNEPFQESSKESYLSYSLADNQTDSRYSWWEWESPSTTHHNCPFHHLGKEKLLTKSYRLLQQNFQSNDEQDEVSKHINSCCKIVKNKMGRIYHCGREKRMQMLNLYFSGYFHFAKFCHLNCISARNSTFCPRGCTN